MEETKFTGWGLVEIMGHVRVAGRLGERSIAGTNLLQVDIPLSDEPDHFRTQFQQLEDVLKPADERDALNQEIAERDATIAELQSQKPLVSAHEIDSQAKAEQALFALVERLEAAAIAADNALTEYGVSDGGESQAKLNAARLVLLEYFRDRDAAISELRKPVAVEVNADVQAVRRLINHGYSAASKDVALVLSAYDALAQDNARFVNAHDVLVAELAVQKSANECLRDGMQRLAGKLVDAQTQNSTLLSDLNAEGNSSKAHCDQLEERERQLREALAEVMQWIDGWDANFCDDEDWQFTRKKVLTALAQAQESNNGTV